MSDPITTLPAIAAHGAMRLPSVELDSYNVERSAVAAEILADSGRLTRVGLVKSHLVQEVRNFLARHPEFAVAPPSEVAGALGERAFLFRRAVLTTEEGLLMTPRRTDTDGFFVALLVRQA